MQEKKFLISLKTKYFQQKPKIKLQHLNQQYSTPKPTKKSKQKTSPSKLSKNFVKTVINDEKDMNDEIFKEYLKYQNPSFFAKNLLKANRSKNKQIINQGNYALIDLKKALNKKEIPKNKNLDKVINIVENTLEFN